MALVSHERPYLGLPGLKTLARWGRALRTRTEAQRSEGWMCAGDQVDP